MADQQTALTYAAKVLGPVTLRRDRSWPHGEATVLEVADGDGTRWIVKQLRSVRHFTGEVVGLTDWAPRLGPGCAPRLVSADEVTQTVVTSWLPGEAGTASSADAYARAGALARTLHGIGPATPDADHAARLAEQLDRWKTRAPGALDAAELDFVRAQIDDLAALPAPQRTSIHNDYQPRNWMIDDAGRLAVFDFGRSGLDLLLRDVERMWFAEWADRPDLREAFFSGYGRALTADEVATIQARGAYQAAGTIGWSREHGDPGFEATGRALLTRLRAGTT